MLGLEGWPGSGRGTFTQRHKGMALSGGGWGYEGSVVEVALSSTVFMGVEVESQRG